MESHFLPAPLVQHVARSLIERALNLKFSPSLMRELSSAPLPAADFSAIGLTAPLTQTALGAASERSVWQRLNPFARTAPALAWADLLEPSAHQPAAAMVFAPLVLDGAPDVLAALQHIPHWFAADGVLFFAILGAGGLPELVNQQVEWLELLGHWPNIMDAGARLQELRFGLPVLDVETVDLTYVDFDVLWADVKCFLPKLNDFSPIEQLEWRAKLHQLFEQGLRDISLQVIYAQVWQVQAPRHASDVHTISLESLTAQLPHKKTFDAED
jgi:hypothetical protein